MNLLRWLGFAEFGAADPDRLHLLGALSKFDHHRLQSATEYLLRLRNEMHFHAGDAKSTCSIVPSNCASPKWLGFQQRERAACRSSSSCATTFRHTNHVWQLVRRREASLARHDGRIAGARSALRPYGRRRLPHRPQHHRRDACRAHQDQAGHARGAQARRDRRRGKQATRPAHVFDAAARCARISRRSFR